MANIAHCNPTEFAYMPFNKAFYSLNLHPTHDFQWDIEIMGDEEEVEGVSGLQPTSWEDRDNYYV